MKNHGRISTLGPADVDAALAGEHKLDGASLDVLIESYIDSASGDPIQRMVHDANVTAEQLCSAAIDQHNPNAWKQATQIRGK